MVVCTASEGQADQEAFERRSVSMNSCTEGHYTTRSYHTVQTVCDVKKLFSGDNDLVGIAFVECGGCFFADLAADCQNGKLVFREAVPVGVGRGHFEIH